MRFDLPEIKIKGKRPASKWWIAAAVAAAIAAALILKEKQ